MANVNLTKLSLENSVCLLLVLDKVIVVVVSYIY